MSRPVFTSCKISRSAVKDPPAPKQKIPSSLSKSKKRSKKNIKQRFHLNDDESGILRL
jgi:hypothetical protein